MTDTSTTDTDTDTDQNVVGPTALVIDLFGAAANEPVAPRPAAKPKRLARPRPRAIGDTSSACAECHPDDPTARYGSCFVCAPAIALG